MYRTTWYQEYIIVGIVLFSSMLCAKVGMISFGAVALPALSLLTK